MLSYKYWYWYISYMKLIIVSLKGWFRFFEVGSYKVHIYSRSVPYHNHRSAQPEFGEAESRSSPDTQLCTAVNGVHRESEINHLKQGLPFFWHYIFSTVEPLYPYALVNWATADLREAKYSARPSCWTRGLLLIKRNLNSPCPSALA